MKSSAKGLIVNSVGVILTSLITFITLPLFTRGLGLEEYAVFAIWIVSINLFQFLDLGLSTTLVQETADRTKCSSTTLVTKSFEVVLLSFYVFLLPFLFLCDFPASEVYSSIVNDAGGAALFLFFIPIFFNNLIKFYSYGLLSRQDMVGYNVFIVTNEFFKQIGGFFIFYYTHDWMMFFLYQCISSSVIYLVIRFFYYSNYKENPKLRLKEIVIIVKRNFRFTSIILCSAIAGGVLSSIDRFTLSLTSSAEDIAIYASCFVVASVINMVIQPFHKISLPIFIELFKQGQYEKLAKEFMFLSSLLSLLSIYLGFFMYFYLELYMDLILDNNSHALAKQIIAFLAIGFWLVSCGWLSANLLQAIGLPSVQLTNMLLAILIGGIVSIYFVSEGFIYAATFIWIVHGLIQSTVLPLRLCANFSAVNIIHWYKTVIITPLFKVLMLFSLLIFINQIAIVYVGIFVSVLWLLLDIRSIFKNKLDKSKVCND